MENWWPLVQHPKFVGFRRTCHFDLKSERLRPISETFVLRRTTMTMIYVTKFPDSPHLIYKLCYKYRSNPSARNLPKSFLPHSNPSSVPPPSVTFFQSYQTMIIYKCRITGDEMLSDAYKILPVVGDDGEEVPGLMEVRRKRMYTWNIHCLRGVTKESQYS